MLITENWADKFGGPECNEAEKHCNAVDLQGNRARRQIVQV